MRNYQCPDYRINRLKHCQLKSITSEYTITLNCTFKDKQRELAGSGLLIKKVSLDCHWEWSLKHWHDLDKYIPLQWIEDNSSPKSPAIDGTPEHHVAHNRREIEVRVIIFIRVESGVPVEHVVLSISYLIWLHFFFILKAKSGVGVYYSPYHVHWPTQISTRWLTLHL